jgi:dihydrofolate synthase / folylpolyglutamate synthase
MVDKTGVLLRLYKTALFHGMQLGLDNARALALALGEPQSAYPCIHVAGSNGKGSVSLKIAKALELSGLKVGLYTSPHLSSFRERMSVNDQLISEEALERGLSKLFALIDEKGIQATFFEIATLLAFDYFREQLVDVAVIETGLGGRLDATNIIAPHLCVITSISLDHVNVLGESLELIAAEKAGIIKPGIPVVIGPKARCNAILKRAEEVSAPLVEAPLITGFYDLENSAIAQAALAQLKGHFPISEEALSKAEQLRPSCRFERVGSVILDVAHNVDGFEHLFEALDWHQIDAPLHFVVGLCQDKDVKGCLDLIASRAKHIHLVQSSNPRAQAPEEMAALLEQGGFTRFSYGLSLEEEMKRALALATSEGAHLVICGSFYIMHAARKLLGIHTSCDSVDLGEKFLR